MTIKKTMSCSTSSTSLSFTTTLCVLLLVGTNLLHQTNAASQLLRKKRAIKKYLTCEIPCEVDDTFSSKPNQESAVSICHFDGTRFQTKCMASRSNIVEQKHANDYCGPCRTSIASQLGNTTFVSSDDLRQAVRRYLDDPTSHEELALVYGYPLGNWDVSQVTDFSHLFEQRIDFNDNISRWNTQSATDMSFMFSQAYSFAGDLSKWNTAQVQTMERMFYAAQDFNSDLSHWKTSQVTNMMGTFWKATSFNSNLSQWDTSKAQTMNRMFADAISFQQDLSPWETHNVHDMSFMFQQATQFQSDLTRWDTRRVTTFEQQFAKVPYYQSISVQKALQNAWTMRPHANLQHMFVAPRDKSLRQQKLERLGANVHTLIRISHHASQAANATQRENAGENNEEEQPNWDDLADEIRCHGGVCL